MEIRGITFTFKVDNDKTPELYHDICDIYKAKLKYYFSLICYSEIVPDDCEFNIIKAELTYRDEAKLRKPTGTTYSGLDELKKKAQTVELVQRTDISDVDWTKDVKEAE